jgi:hypothetical protein
MEQDVEEKMQTILNKCIQHHQAILRWGQGRGCSLCDIRTSAVISCNIGCSEIMQIIQILLRPQVKYMTSTLHVILLLNLVCIVSYIKVVLTKTCSAVSTHNLTYT